LEGKLTIFFKRYLTNKKLLGATANVTDAAPPLFAFEAICHVPHHAVLVIIEVVGLILAPLQRVRERNVPHTPPEHSLATLVSAARAKCVITKLEIYDNNETNLDIVMYTLITFTKPQ
jgi:hypothetical protein